MEFFGSYAGADFLLFYALMLATCVIAGLWIPANLRPVGRRGEANAAEELAVLSGGKDRHANVVTADLVARGALVPGKAGQLKVAQPDAKTGSAGRTLLRKTGEFGPGEISESTAGDAAVIESRLISAGLLMNAGERTKLRWLSAAPYAALLAIGLYRQQAGSAAGEATGLLVVMMVITAVCALIRLFKSNPRTVSGNEALRVAEANAARMRIAPTVNEAGYAVALFGTAVLVGTPWEPVHAMRQSGDGAGGYAGDHSDGGDGGGGCGGGGCGGCGG